MESHLKEVYGFNNFRGSQKEIITDILNKEDVVAILPTGGGKSLLYQFPATFSDKITVVVSPLISLMNDQCKYLNSKNIKTVCLNSETKIGIGHYIKYKIIYTTPEFIISRIHAFVRIREHIGLFAIDEAHCVSQWSHDFRTSYQRLGVLKKSFPEVPLLAVTATATPKVLEEMYEFLNITEVNEYSLGTRRTNLIITVKPKSEFTKCKFTEPTIVYVQTRKLCEKLCNDFIKRGIPSARYHGGMPKDEKEKSHELFIKGEITVIVATISFGMGIDKSDIRHVINYGVPANIESYYQEIGRAGRDGINSKATIYYNDSDFMTTEFLISLSPDEDQIRIKTVGMNNFRSYLRERHLCRQQMIDYYFDTGNFASEDDVTKIPKCNMCDNCTRVHTTDISDVSAEASNIYNIIRNHHINTRFDFGFKKTVDMIRKQSSIKKTTARTKSIMEILITRNVLCRYKAGRGFAIGVGKKKLADILPLMARIEEGLYKMNVSLRTTGVPISTIMDLRNRLAKKYEMVPANFINDRVIMNIHEKKPKNAGELWKVDGISNEFIMSSNCVEFMKEYVEINSKSSSRKGSSPRKKKSGKTIDTVYKLFKENKSIKEIATHIGIKESTTEGHILHILEHYEDVEIDMDYVGLTEEKEERIKCAVKKVGISKLRPIKDNAGKNITYAQIKVCLLVMKIEAE
jgi:ATP-dependent DNA helicase RecQ